jgi:formiminotetrahydrofolate cyclodeaminase
MEPLARLTLSRFLADLAARRPTPGGGAVAASTAATAAALASMVVAFSTGRKGNESGAESVLSDLAARLERARALCLQLADEDAEAYEILSAALKTPKDDPERAGRVALAAHSAVQPPRAVLAVCADLSRVLESLRPLASPHLLSDLAISAALVGAGARAALWNIRANAPLLDPGARAVVGESERIAGDARRRCDAVEESCAAP